MYTNRMTLESLFSRKNILHVKLIKAIIIHTYIIVKMTVIHIPYILYGTQLPFAVLCIKLAGSVLAII